MGKLERFGAGNGTLSANAADERLEQRLQLAQQALADVAEASGALEVSQLHTVADAGSRLELVR